MDLQFRDFETEDWEAIRAITIESFDGVSIDRNIEDRLGVVAEADWKERKVRTVRMDFDRPAARTIVARTSEGVIGYITTWIDQASRTGFIPNLAVARAHRGRGIGRQLIERALEHFRGSGALLARIETLEQNPIGQTLYPRMGFVEVARQIHYCQRLDRPAEPRPGAPATGEPR